MAEIFTGTTGIPSSSSVPVPEDCFVKLTSLLDPILQKLYSLCASDFIQTGLDNDLKRGVTGGDRRISRRCSVCNQLFKPVVHPHSGSDAKEALMSLCSALTLPDD